MKKQYTAEEAYAMLASASDGNETDTASDFDPGQFSDTDSNASVTAPLADEPAAKRSHTTDPSPAADAGDGEVWVPPNQTSPVIPPFTATPGIKVDVAGFTPVQYLDLFLGEYILTMIASQTNIYAANYIAAHPTCSFSKQQNWDPTDAMELRRFWALTLCMGIIKKPSIRSYWSKDIVMSTPIFPHTMPRLRYEMLLGFLHFNDNSQCPPKEDPRYDRLYKIRPLLTHFQARFAELYTPQQNLAIDESLMKFKGRLAFKQYIPSKRSRYGVKFYKLCESESGYVHAFRIYEGKDCHLDPPGCPEYLGTSAKIVWDLMLPLLNKGYHLYLDNFYTSVPLFRLLYCFETVACGTIRSNRKGFPAQLAKTQLKKGEYSALRRQELLALKFRDKKDVRMLSTIHNESTMGIPVHGSGGVTLKPVCVRAYNKHMGGVDLADQLLQPYLIMRKCRAWYKKVAIYMMQIATHNAFLIFKKSHPGAKTFLQFQLRLISEMLTSNAPGPSAVSAKLLREIGLQKAGDAGFCCQGVAQADLPCRDVCKNP
ncbi:piggyBac transposable element-derived protein 4-like [Spea bombifrons]|uniref:piggyBac transposable element-derived protein 4-like n=1 Tax=Spea bombifrons TaxID=233779 RepID=UPI00234BFEC7|nr:piggyBac transposable element-derived protein 4-like [Spea bombifrons]